MLKIAITGNIAAGKTRTENIIKANGYNVLDTDTITHELLENEIVKEIIKKTFINYDICENNQISRIKLGKIVFGNKKLKEKLEKILHPLIKEKIDEFFEKNKNEKFVFVAVPLLFEANFEKYFDKIILIYANDEIRLQRLMKRNNLSKEDALKRIKSQISQDNKIHLADYVIHCDKSFPELHSDVKNLLKLL